MPASEKLKELIRAADDNLSSNREVLKWMNSMVDQMEGHQTAVRASKTAAAAGGVVSTVLLLTPLAPFGIAGLVASSITGAGATIGDIVKTSASSNEMQTKLKYLQDSSKRLEKLQKAVQEEATTLANESGISKDEAYDSILQGVMNTANITGNIIRIGGSAAAASGLIAAGAGTVVTVSKVATDVARLSISSVSTAASLSEVAVAGAGGVAIVAKGGAEVAVGATRATIGVAAAGIGAVIGIADAIYSWSSTNASLDTARELVSDINKGIGGMKKMKEALESIKMRPVNNLTVVVGSDLIEMSKQIMAAGNNTTSRGRGGTSNKQSGGQINTPQGGKQVWKKAGGNAAGSGDDPNDDRNNPKRIFDGLESFASGNLLYEMLCEWLEGMLENLLHLSEHMVPDPDNPRQSPWILSPLPGQVNPQGEPLLKQFAFTQLLQYTMSTNTLMTVPFVPSVARPSQVEGRPVRHSEEHLLADDDDPLTIDVDGNQNGTIITVIFTQNFTCQAQRGEICSCFDRVTEFAQQNPGSAVFVMYSQPWPRIRGCWANQIGSNDRFLNNHQLPMNIAFMEVDFTISQGNVSVLNLRLTGRPRRNTGRPRR